jgi:hypothetical protein
MSICEHLVIDDDLQMSYESCNGHLVINKDK